MLRDDSNLSYLMSSTNRRYRGELESIKRAKRGKGGYFYKKGRKMGIFIKKAKKTIFIRVFILTPPDELS